MGFEINHPAIRGYGTPPYVQPSPYLWNGILPYFPSKKPSMEWGTPMAMEIPPDVPGPSP